MMGRVLRPFVASAGVALLAAAATAQTSEICYTDSINLTPTDWTNSVSVPKFDPILGDLVSIRFTLSGHIEGTAAVENFSPSSGTVANLQFSSTLTLTRPDNSVLVITIPVANFTDPLTTFDGTIDFAGASGETHNGIVADDSDTVVSPPPASDLVLFTGPGSISLPVTAAGTSIATGGGNLISSFTQSASATVEVCYTYVVNVPPVFDGPCGQTIGASAGVPVGPIQICASDVEPGDTVTLSVGPLPPGATLAPSLPTSGNPVCTTFNWTPTAFDVGSWTITFTAVDSNNRTSSCSFTIVVAECYQFLGRGSGNAGLTIGGQFFQSQLGGIRQIFPVTMIDRPSLRIPNLATGQWSFSVQTVMHNAEMFPQNPDQWSQRLRVVISPGQVVTGELFGTLNGIHQQLTTFTDPLGEQWMSFPFTIDGM